MAEDHVPRRPVSCQPGYSGRWRGPLRCEAGRPHLQKRTLFAEISAAGISACAWLGAPRRSRPHPPSARALARYRHTPSGAVGHGRARCPPVQALAPLPLHPARVVRHGRSAAGGPYTSPLWQSALAWPQSASRALDRLCERPESVGGAGVEDTAGAGTYPRPRATNSGHFEGSRRRSQHGDWHCAARWMAACTGPSRYSTHKVGLEDMGRQDPPSGCACALAERAAARRLSGLHAVVEPSRAPACGSGAPNAAPVLPVVVYRPETRAAAPRSRLTSSCTPIGRAGSCSGWGANTDLLAEDAL